MALRGIDGERLRDRKIGMMDPMPRPIAAAPTGAIGSRVGHACLKVGIPLCGQAGIEGICVGCAKEIAAGTLGIIDDEGQIGLEDLVGDGEGPSRSGSSSRPVASLPASPVFRQIMASAG